MRPNAAPITLTMPVIAEMKSSYSGFVEQTFGSIIRREGHQIFGAR
jgi:hypothetical protein